MAKSAAKMVVILISGIVFCFVMGIMLETQNVMAAKEMEIAGGVRTLYLNQEDERNPPDEVDLRIKRKPKNYKTIYSFRWYADDKDIVAVYKGGLVKAKKPGVTTVRCDIKLKEDKSLYKSLECLITVKNNIETVTGEEIIEGEEDNENDTVGERPTADENVKLTYTIRYFYNGVENKKRIVYGVDSLFAQITAPDKPKKNFELDTEMNPTREFELVTDNQIMGIYYKLIEPSKKPEEGNAKGDNK